MSSPSVLRPSPSSSPVARPDRLSYSPAAAAAATTSRNNSRNNNNNNHRHHQHHDNTSTNSTAARNLAKTTRRSSNSSDILHGSAARAGSSSSNSNSGRRQQARSSVTSGPSTHTTTTVAAAPASLSDTTTLVGPASPAGRPKRARASPDPVPSPHPTHREFNSPREPLPASSSLLTSSLLLHTGSSSATTSTNPSVYDSTATSFVTPAAHTQLYVNAGTQYSPPDFPPTSIRSSLHPSNRAIAARAAATALLRELSTSTSSSISSESSDDCSGERNNSTSHQPTNPSRPDHRQHPSAATSAPLAGATSASQGAHQYTSFAGQQAAVAAADVASSGRLATPPNEAGSSSSSPLAAASSADPRLRLTRQAAVSNTANATRSTASTTVPAGASAADGSSHGERSSSSSAHREASTSTAPTAMTTVATAPRARGGSSRLSSAQIQTSSTTHTDAQPQLLPADYSQCDASILSSLIADMLMELIRFNDEIPLQDGHLTRFHSRAPPSISVHDYLARLTFHATLSPPILLSMVFLIDKLCLLFPAFTINSLTVHRFLITAATVASKGLSDSFWTNQTYARCGGVTVRELAMLEIELLSRIQWRIVPQPEALYDYYVNLVARNPVYQMDRVQGINPEIEETGNEMDIDEIREDT